MKRETIPEAEATRFTARDTGRWREPWITPKGYALLCRARHRIPKQVLHHPKGKHARGRRQASSLLGLRTRRVPARDDGSPRP